LASFLLFVAYRCWSAIKTHFWTTPELYCLVVTSIANVLFFICIYPGVTRHFGHVFIGFEVFLWLMYTTGRHTADQKIKLDRILLVSTALFVLWGAYAAYQDHKLRYSSLEVAADCIRADAKSEPYLITGYPDYLVDAMTDLSGKDAFYALGLQRMTQSVSWNHHFSQRLPTQAEAAQLAAQQQQTIYLITNRDTCQWLAPYLLCTFEADLRTDEGIRVYVVRR
jgi:hypothetical protein